MISGLCGGRECADWWIMARKSSRAMWAAHLAGEGRRTAAAAGSAVDEPAPVGRPFRGVVLGIDPSLRGTGLALVSIEGRDVARLIAHRVVRVSVREAMPACLAAIFRAVSECLDREDVRHVALEETIYVQNFQTAQRLGAARGAAITAAALSGHPVFEYPPLRIKQAVTGFGRASKEQMIRQIRDLLRLREPLLSDAADAAGAAICHAATWKETDGELVE